MILQLLWENPPIFLVWVLAIIFGITIHEFSHALIGYLLGDNTAKSMGRLTLNPFSHLDLFGFMLLLVAGFGWGKPVPFNPNNLKNKRYGPALVALAGPISNLAAILVFGICLKLIASFTSLGGDNLLVLFVIFLIQINMVLMIFNLLPIPPLDGSKVLFALLPRSLDNIRLFLQRFGPMLILGLIVFDQWLGFNYLGKLFAVIYQFILDVIL